MEQNIYWDEDGIPPSREMMKDKTGWLGYKPWLKFLNLLT